MSEIAEGIYLETKQSQLGTGHTSSNVVFRTFWAARPAGGQVEVYLLDNQLGPTGLAELMSPAEFLGKGWMHVPRLDARYQGLKGKLKPVAQAAPETPAAPPAKAVPAAPQAKPASAPAAAKPAPKPQAEGGWWEMTSRGSNMLIKK